MAEQSPLSSPFTSEWAYDVFLNFRGEDTRFDFSRNLYEALHQKGIHTFIDDERLPRGEEITPSLVKAIQESRIAITIFSKNYAASTFCLDELVHILEYIKKKGRLVLPVFYDVDPSEVRHHKGNYREAFAEHDKRFINDKKNVQKWRLALQDAANLSGFHFIHGQEYEWYFIEGIVKEVSKRINRKPLHIVDHPVGLESQVLKINSLLDAGSNEGVQMVGICGIGGIGKTTLARAACNLIADLFDGFCFLANVRENSTKHGLIYLQEKLLSEVIGEDISFSDVNQGIPILKQRLHQKKVLLVLDDVDKLKELEVVAGALDWFCSGSRIIVTTRDKHLLARHGVKRIYEVESLNHKEAVELLTWNAFRQNRIDPSYKDNLNSVIRYAGGLPLALEVIGSNLFNRGISEWNSALDSYQRIPVKEIQQVLRVSYDALEEHEQEIFLDIACCFKGDRLEYVTKALYARGICPNYAIKVLIDKCLVNIDSGHVTMHNLIQDMGKEIVRQQSPKDPGKRTRLWFHKDILHVLEENKGSEKIEAINLEMPRDKEIDWSGTAFRKMRNLKILIVRNAQFSTCPKYLPNSLRVLDWKGYPYPSLPHDFYPKQLVIFKMPESYLALDKPLKMFHSMSVMDFKGCKFLRAVPDLSGVPNLEELWLDGCGNLVEVHVSVGFLGKLKRLSIKNCRKITNFPDVWLPSLEFLDLSWCFSLQRFPEVLGTMENITDVRLDHSGINELPFSFRNLIGLQHLKLSNSEHLREVRAVPPKLQELEVVDRNLSSEYGRILLSQALSEVDGLMFIIQEERTPKWFDHYTDRKRHTISFWIQNKFPNTALCFDGESDVRYYRGIDLNGWVYSNGELIASLDDEEHTLIDAENEGQKYHQVADESGWVITNGKCIGSLDYHTIYGSITTQHVFLFDLRPLVPEDKLKGRVVLDHQWNHVRISCYLSNRNYHADEGYRRYGITRANWSGIYVYKQKSRLDEAIRFRNRNG